MKKLVLALLLFVSISATLRAEWVQTPFGPAWIGPNRPAEPPQPPTPPKPAPFVPTYEQGVTVNISINGKIVPAKLNEQYFATQATADYLCAKFFCVASWQQPYAGAKGPYTATQQERWLGWSDGAGGMINENAGILAAFYTRNPEDKFPGLADWYINQILKDARGFGFSTPAGTVMKFKQARLEF